jgi:HEAT repeat protein
MANSLNRRLRLTLDLGKQKSLSSNKKDGTSQIERYIDLISNEQFSVRVAATKELSGLGREAVPALLRALHEGLWYTRECAALALGRIGDLQAIGPLIDRLGDENVGVRRSAANALSGLVEGDRLAEVAEAISQYQPADRKDIIEAIRRASPLAGRKLDELLGEGLQAHHKREGRVAEENPPSGDALSFSSKSGRVRSLWDGLRAYFQSRS